MWSFKIKEIMNFGVLILFFKCTAPSWLGEIFWNSKLQNLWRILFQFLLFFKPSSAQAFLFFFLFFSNWFCVSKFPDFLHRNFYLPENLPFYFHSSEELLHLLIFLFFFSFWLNVFHSCLPLCAFFFYSAFLSQNGYAYFLKFS